MTKASWMSSALAAAFALSFPAGGFAATETVNGIKWTYTIDDGRATLGGTDRSPLALARTTAGAVSIPSRLGGRPVTEIGERAFYNCAQITAVTIPDTVDEIGEEAFSGCAALASVSLPTSLREIDDRAFALCRSLKGTLEIPEGVRDVGFGAFMGTGLDTLVFPSTLLELGAQQTASGTPLTAVYFKGNAPKLDDEFPPSRADENSPYYGSLASLVTYVKVGTTGWKDRTSALPATWPARVPRKIQNFSGALPAWHIDSSGTLTKVELNGCTEVAIPASVKKIADYAFFGASGLKSVSFPESVSAIGVKAFKGCSALSSVTLPNGLKTLGQAAFQDCTSLKEIEVPAGIDYLWSSTFEGCTALEKVSLPEGITAIGTSSFANCKALEEVNIPRSVRTIKSFAFFSCENLEDVELPAGLVNIEQKAFKNCTDLDEIEIPSSVTSLGKAAFFNSGLVEATVPGGIAKVDDYCFQKCAALRKVTLSEGVKETGASVWANGGALEEVVFPRSLETLGGYAFFRCPSLATLWNFSNLSGLSTVGEKAFKHCTSLKTLAMPSHIVSLPKEMCNYCASLETVTGTGNVTRIGQSAFSNCPRLKSVAGLDAAALVLVKRGREWKK